MQYLKKNGGFAKNYSDLSYESQGDRLKIKGLLLREQMGFCAYSERFIKNTDETHIEHFDPRLKNTTQDSSQNWYATLPWFNSHKPKNIEPFLPILSPLSPDLEDRIEYKKGLGIFSPKSADDIEAQNLIKFLRWDMNELSEDCKKHIQRIKDLQELCGDESFFRSKLLAHKDNMSFATALKAELGIDVIALMKGE